jgi:hypothetical protein
MTYFYTVFSDHQKFNDLYLYNGIYKLGLVDELRTFSTENKYAQIILSDLVDEVRTRIVLKSVV